MRVCVCVLQEQEDPNKLATSWPDYYIDRINSMAAVSADSSSPLSLQPEDPLERSPQRPDSAVITDDL